VGTWDGRAAIAYAHALTRGVGLEASAGLDVTSTTVTIFDPTRAAASDAKITRIVPAFGVAFSLQPPAKSFPIGGLVEYSLALPNTKDETPTATKTTSVTHTLVLGLVTNARKDVEVGLYGSLQFGLDPAPGQDEAGAVQPSDKPSTLGLAFAVRHFW
jgi:hypothetical protein